MAQLIQSNKEKPQKYLREREKCDSFICQHSNSTLKSDLINLIQKKCKELIDITTANLIDCKWNKLPTSKNINETLNRNKLPTLQDIQENENWNKLPCMIREEFVPKLHTGLDTFKHCKTCGRVIINPKPRQKFCSPKEVGETQAHKCRNKDSNPRNKTKYAVNKINLHQTLFNIIDFIRTDRKDYLIQES